MDLLYEYMRLALDKNISEKRRLLKDSARGPNSSKYAVGT